MQVIEIIFTVAILLMSVVIHEVSHGFVAYLDGDPTAYYAGRLTLNPLVHLDIVGSFIVPLITYFLAGVTFGWAKPVPYNPYNLRHGRWGELMVALAGPLSNILIAVIFGLIIRFGEGSLPTSFLMLAGSVTFINIGLAIFNLVPVPPLDGSKVLFSLLPVRFQQIRRQIEQYSFIILLFFVFFLSQYLAPVMTFLFVHLTGATL